MRRYPFLALALALAACGDDSDDPIPPERMAIEILRGDHFRDTVYLGGPARAVGAVVYEPVAVGELEVSPEPLVARFGERLTQPSASLTGPSFATLPANTTADWVIVDEDGYPITDGRCGRPVNTTTIPASDGTTTNYWQRPRKAGTCYMRLQGVVDGQPYVDTVFTRVFLPGPLVPTRPFEMSCFLPISEDGTHQVGDVITCRGGDDANGNPTDQYRVEAIADWLEPIGGEFGTPEARSARVLRTPAIGETATLRLYDAQDDLIIEVVGTVKEAKWTYYPTGYVGTGWRLHVYLP